MAVYPPDRIRNIALAGHSGCGKTSLAEALLFKAGATNRLGSVQDGTSILDNTDEEREKLCSLDSAMCHLSHKDHLVNIIDAPGAGAFCGYAIASLAATDCVAILVSASAGIEVNTRKMFERARKFGIGIWLVINHIDAPNLDLPGLVTQLQESFGQECVPLNLPAASGKSVIDCMAQDSGDADFSSVSDAHTAVVEAVVAADDALMEKYLGGDLSDEEAQAAAARAVAAGEFVPILFTDACGDVGIVEFLDALITCCPSPLTAKQRTLIDGETETAIVPTQDAPFVGQVFKIYTDLKTHIKQLGIRVLSGKLSSDMLLKTVDAPKGTRPGHILKTQGAETEEIEAGLAGDIITLAKLDFAIGDVLYTDQGGTVAMPVFPQPMFSLALESKSRGDEDKISLALKRFADEDACFISERGTGGELVVRGMGEAQLRAYLNRMAKHFKLEVETKPPRIPYRETITGRADHVEYTHKKQTGGAGQFARVFINMYPAERGEGYEFLDKIFGGAIDQQFRPSVDKGIKAQMAEGVIAGYPVVDVKVELVDGKTHPVDSKDIAFQVAGRHVFKEAFHKCKPCLLEPIVNLEVTLPADKVGDIQGDLASRRGRPQGQEMLPGNMAVIRGAVPLSEVADYNSRLSSITGGQGSYSMELSHYEVVPSNVQQQIVAAAKKEREAAHS